MSSTVIKCVAGSGKTTAAVQNLDNIDNGIYLAFNNKIVNEVAEKGYIAKTIDSFFISYVFPKLITKIPAFNCKDVEISYLNVEKLANYKIGASEIGVDVDGNITYKNCPIGYSLNDELEYLSNVDGKYSYQIKVVFTNRKINISDKFREDLLGYVLHNFLREVLQIVKSRFDYLIIDEAQDLKGYKEELIKQLYDNDVKLIILGDENQNINNGGDWFSAINPTERITKSYRCSEKVCKWIREKLGIDIYGNETDANVYEITFDELRELDNGSRTLLYKAKIGRFESIINGWKGCKLTIQKSKGLTIDEDIVIVGTSLNKNFYYTSLTRTTKNAYTTIKKINN